MRFEQKMIEDMNSKDGRTYTDEIEEEITHTRTHTYSSHMDE